jgi:hypothetical protein
MSGCPAESLLPNLNHPASSQQASNSKQLPHCLFSQLASYQLLNHFHGHSG